MQNNWLGRAVLAGVSLGSALVAGAGSAQVTNWGTFGAPYDEKRPAPAWIGADIPVIVNSPSPSDVNNAFFGPYLFIKAARVDLVAGTVTLPLKKGRMASGETVWYVVTDTSDKGISELLGVNYAPKMIFTDIDRGVRRATVDSKGTLVFERGKVDFSPKLSLVPGDAPNYFPPKSAQPGSVGDEYYTPLVKTTNGNSTVVYNAPVVSFGTTEAQLNAMCGGNPNHDLVHDKVLKICPRTGFVTLKPTLGYSFGKPVLYLSFDSNDKATTTLEEATFTPVYDQQGFNLPDAAIGSGVERIMTIVNGAGGKTDINRQGLNSAIHDGRGPINILGGIPNFNLDYSPIWKLFVAKWTPQAIKQGYRTRIIDWFQAYQYNARGYLVNMDGKQEIQPAGIAINCPIVMRLN